MKNEIVYDTRTFSDILWGRTNVPDGFFVTGSLLDRRHQPCNCLLNLAFASIASTIDSPPRPIGAAGPKIRDRCYFLAPPRDRGVMNEE